MSTWDDKPNYPQGSDAWFQARLGKLTASRIADATARVKSGWGASRDNLMAELLIERLTGQRPPQYTNAAMEWGTQMEPEARTVYEFEQNVTVEECGFIPHPTIAMAGASPDGLVGDMGLVEFKCPNTATHIATLLGEPIAEKYVKQVLWQLDTTSREWCDFVSYDPRLPEYVKDEEGTLQPVNLRMHIQRIEFDARAIEKLRKEAVEFLDELAARQARLLDKYVRGKMPDSLWEQLRQSAAVA